MGSMMAGADTSADEWTGLQSRVAAYLRASRVSSPELINRLSHQIVTAARHRHGENPDRLPTELVAEETRRLVEEWASRFIEPPKNESVPHRFAHARAAVWLADLPEHWSHSFLDPAEQPEEFGRLFQGTYLQAGPKLDFSNMGPRPIDLGPVSSLAGETWKTFDKWPILQGVALWGLFLAVLLMAFLATRY